MAMCGFLRLAIASFMIFATTAASAELAKAPSDADLQRAIVGSWGIDDLACETNFVTFSDSGVATVQGRQAGTATFQIKDGTLTFTINGKTDTNRIEVEGDTLKILNSAGGVLKKLPRCATRASATPVKSQTDAELQRAIIGTWAETAAKCSTDSGSFSTDGTIAVGGSRPTQGTFQIKDGNITSIMNGKTDTFQLAIEGDTLKVTDAQGNVKLTLVRCAEPSRASGGDGVGTPAVAAPDPAVLAPIRALVDKAVSEQRVFLNCSRTEPTQYELLAKSWQQDIAKAKDMLSASPETSGYIGEFTKKTDMAALLMDDQPFSKVIRMCDGNKDWMKEVNLLRYTILSMSLSKLLQKP
jgi:hypothetical protein